MEELFPVLEFPRPALQFQQTEQHLKVWDAFRKKWIVHTPEEWVRQHLLHFLVEQGYPAGCIQVERMVNYNGLRKRFDILVRDRNGNPWLLVECKAQTIPISLAESFQIATYNRILGAPYLCLSNGKETYMAIITDTGIEKVNNWPVFNR